MSRIEKALERAMKMRDSGKPAAHDAGGALPMREVQDEEGLGRCRLTIENPYIITPTGSQTPLSEEYKKLKSEIVKRTKKDGSQNVIMVTSSVGGEGKSITAINLAISLSQELDHSALLVDADIRNPSIAKYLGITTGTGLSDCLIDGSEARGAVIRTGMEKLSVLPSGRAVENPVELLSSRRMKDLIQEVKHGPAGRYVVIDTPPILPFAETREVSRIVDGVVFVVREGTAPLQSIEEALALLKDTNLLGIVYTGASMEHLNGRYGSYYYRDYRSRKDTDKV
jgi:protein-tyrosine kinase